MLSAATAADRLMTAEETMARLRLESPAALRWLRQTGRLGYVRVGHRTLLYQASEIERFIRENTVEAA